VQRKQKGFGFFKSVSVFNSAQLIFSSIWKTSRSAVHVKCSQQVKCKHTHVRWKASILNVIQTVY